MQSPDDSTAQTLAKIAPEGTARHVFLCVGPECCSNEAGLETWERLKQILKSHGIPAMRTKAACLRVCSGGPWMVVYPEGVWYGQVTPERCERIVREHLLEGRPIKDWVAHTRCLGA